MVSTLQLTLTHINDQLQYATQCITYGFNLNSSYYFLITPMVVPFNNNHLTKVTDCNQPNTNHKHAAEHNSTRYRLDYSWATCICLVLCFCFLLRLCAQVTKQNQTILSTIWSLCNVM